MKLASTTALILALLSLSGCAYSIAPLASEDTLVAEPDLSGTWEVKSKPVPSELDEVSLEKVTEDAEGTYWLRFGGVTDSQDVFCADLLKLGDTLYLELSDVEAFSQLWSTALFRVHRVRVSDTEVQVDLCNDKKLEEIVVQEQLPHVRQTERFIIAATTEQLQQFYRKHGSKFFSREKCIRLRKKPPANSKEQGNPQE
jgi:hypothetical protein